MKKILPIIALLFAMMSTSCTSYHFHTSNVKKKHYKAPPGQVKKFTGSKSAKKYAPGQRKKKKS